MAYNEMHRCIQLQNAWIFKYSYVCTILLANIFPFSHISDGNILTILHTVPAEKVAKNHDYV